MEQWRILAAHPVVSSVKLIPILLRARVEKVLSRLSDARIKSYFWKHRPLRLLLYRGYRSSACLFVQGRVLLGDPITAKEDDSVWRNFMNAIRKFNSDEVAGAKIELKYGSRVFEVLSDAEGYFDLHVPFADDGQERLHDRIEARLLEAKGYIVDSEQCFEGRIENFSAAARLAILTDIDDTLLKTEVTSLLKLRALFLTLTRNAYTRMPFAGAATLLNMLAHGELGAKNPMFYVSNSPWNLYRLLERFLDHHQFPGGPIFLRDLGFRYEGGKDSSTHKPRTIDHLIRDFPDLDFVLVGDSGERDAIYYLDAARRHPGRVKAIIIRQVKNDHRAIKVKNLFDQFEGDALLALVPDSGIAAQVLAQAGLLSAAQAALVVEASEVGNPTFVPKEV